MRSRTIGYCDIAKCHNKQLYWRDPDKIITNQISALGESSNFGMHNGTYTPDSSINKPIARWVSKSASQPVSQSTNDLLKAYLLLLIPFFAPSHSKVVPVGKTASSIALVTNPLTRTGAKGVSIEICEGLLLYILMILNCTMATQLIRHVCVRVVWRGEEGGGE